MTDLNVLFIKGFLLIIAGNTTTSKGLGAILHVLGIITFTIYIFITIKGFI